MLSLTTATVARPAASPWSAALYAAIFTAIAAVIVSLLFQAATGWLWVALMVLVGIGPVLGYQVATGRLGDWKSILGGLIGALPLIGLILWPFVTGAMTRGQSIGKLALWHVVGLLLAVGAFFLLATIVGQNPSWVGPGYVVATAVWGGTMGAAMAASAPATATA